MWVPVLVLATEPTVGFSPSRLTTSVGDTVTVDVIMQNFPISEGGGITIRFNPAVVQVIRTEVDMDTWSYVGSAGIIDNEGGTVSNILFSSFTGVSDTALIATVQFEAVKSGNAKLRIEASSLNPFSSAGVRVPAKLGRGILKVGGGGENGGH